MMLFEIIFLKTKVPWSSLIDANFVEKYCFLCKIWHFLGCWYWHHGLPDCANVQWCRWTSPFRRIVLLVSSWSTWLGRECNQFIRAELHEDRSEPWEDYLFPTAMPLTTHSNFKNRGLQPR
jgi:hypothetical protein